MSVRLEHEMQLQLARAQKALYLFDRGRFRFPTRRVKVQYRVNDHSVASGRIENHVGERPSGRVEKWLDGECHSVLTYQLLMAPRSWTWLKPARIRIVAAIALRPPLRQ